jgi:16S rRNA (cytosine1402-N4)-methyltransferase
MPEATHRPVLLCEAVAALGCAPGGRWVDGTIGLGGHAAAILAASAPDGRLFGVDRDAAALEIARRRLQPFGDRVVLRQARHEDLPGLLDRAGFVPADGILLDLGISSLQIDDPGRGFSFLADGPLDMRMDRSQPTTAADLVNTLPERDLARLIRRFGEEPAAGAIARAVARERRRAPIDTTVRLAAVVARAVPRRGARPRIHPATRVFQAIRIAVNGEIEALDATIEALASRLRPGRRLAVIAFHSLEDRIVKQTFRALERRCVCPREMPACACGRPGIGRALTRRPARPGEAEIDDNPRSRSARLRAFERTA